MVWRYSGISPRSSLRGWILGCFAAAWLALPAGSAQAQGLVAQATGGTGAAAKGAAFPLHGAVTLSTSLGNGILADGMAAQPNLSQTLTLIPSFALPVAEGMPAMNLAGRLNLSTQWLSNFQGTFGANSADRLVRLSDFTLILNVPTIFREANSGLRIGTNLQARAPLSLTSRLFHVLTTVGVNFPVNWSTAKLDLPVGLFFFSYVPSANYTQHLEPNPSMPCSAGGLDPFGNRFGAAAQQLESVPLVIPRAGEVTAEGKCIIRGRRIIGTLAHSGVAGWAAGNHTLIVSAAYFNQFFAPLQDQPELKSAYASTQSFVEWSSGTVAYAYQIPNDVFGLPPQVSANITTGITSFQPIWDNAGENIRFPFWDFITPANNFSAFFVDLNVGI